eukprot:TRINITY_DN12176_c0_g1_i1.p1 TRINITY_DN12176_c0_g1~~TRINITY_DN12176_c0_g1_i1.p1  ORF type:complete len:150 (+),score=35.18 TRINITY_DN12176_c0_g1_i1:62-451(+)
MSLTADGEFFKCDMCGVYFHMNIFCSHRRQCKGADSQEMKKEQIEEATKQLDKEERDRMQVLSGLNSEFDGRVCRDGGSGVSKLEAEFRNAPLDRQEELQRVKRNTKMQQQMWEEEKEIPCPEGFFDDL